GAASRGCRKTGPVSLGQPCSHAMLGSARQCWQCHYKSVRIIFINLSNAGSWTAPMINRLILLEFNELCPSLIERFIAAGALPNFERLRNGAQVFTTATSDEHVQPWVQWVTFHLGVPQVAHKIDNLDEGHLIDRPALWDELAPHGLESLVFGAM